LVVPGALVQAEELQAQEEARRTSSAAVVAREESQLKYSELSSVEAGKVAQEVFPALIDEPAGGPPKLPAGESITSFPAVNVARVGGEGEHGVIESAEPIAVESSPGQRVPVDLGLGEVGGAFEPKTPVVGVRVPKQLNNGVGLPAVGVSLTPVDSQGSPLGGSEGSVVGATALYANTQTDADTVVKPTTLGFEVDTVLRSVRSPQQLDYKVGLPEGASLVQEEEGSGSVQIVEGGVALAVVVAPSARDAEGTPVPVEMRIVSGDVLAVTVASFADAAYRMPIAVDPEIEDAQFSNESLYHTEWHFEHVGAQFKAPEQPEKGSWAETITDGHNSSEWGGLFYTTRGASQIMRAEAMGHWNDTGSHIQNYMVLYAPAHTESYSPLPAEAGAGSSGFVCAPERKCPETVEAGVAENENTAAYEQEATGAGEGHSGSNTLTNASVIIKQEVSPEVKFNTTSATIYNSETKEYLSNVLYGSGSWLGPHSGAYEVKAKDPGIGLSLYAVTGGGTILDDRDFYFGWPPGCHGVQCPAEENQGYLYNNRLANGEDSFEAKVEDEAGLYATAKPSLKVKVDAAPPHGIKVSGLVNGDELPLGETHLEVEAADGEGTTKSSGMKAIKVSVDGREVPGTSASCPEGPCNASTKVTLAARDYSSGQHSLVVTATDNAGNVAQEEFTFRVHGTAPVSVGPGSVDPSNGQLTLSATDVSLGGTSGVSRTYQSRDLTAGVEGPLGPQWAVDLGGDESLTVAVNGNAILNASGGASTAFTRNEKGEFEAPNGDTDLKLEAKEKTPGKGISEYLLTDAAAGTKTKFEQPTTESGQQLTPSFVNGFGAEAGQLRHPNGDAVDPSGNLWVVSGESDLIEKFSPTGTLLATYGSQGTAEGQYIGPWGIAIDPRNGDVYVSDEGNDRIDELSSSGAFIKAFGWGVGKAGKSEFEICTKECKSGIAGAGNGQFSTIAAGMSVDSSGNVWVVDYGDNRVQEFNEKGEYLQKFGSEGSGGGQFQSPDAIALSGGNLYVTDVGNNRVQEFSTAGAFIKTIGWGVSNGEAKEEICTKECKAGIAGSGNGQFAGPKGIATDPATGNLYVVDNGNKRVQELTSGGAFITKFGVSGTGVGDFVYPSVVAVSSSGNVYVVDNGANDVDEWMRPEWVPSEVGGPLAASATTYAYTAVEEEGKAAIEPTEALAPVPTGVSSCTPVVRGCRALTFKYATETTAKGENRGEWGEYKGHLSKVIFHAYNSSTKEMTETTVAEYSYDSKGRLRAEWDPRISPALKTVYGYDSEGHVTAITLPGEETWAQTYGTIAGDSNTGRLLKATQAPATTVLWKGEIPANTVLPKLSGTAVVGVALGVSNGTWSNEPVAYAYQWEDCNSSGKECTPILGATNANYKATSSDVGHTLVARIEATNGGGSVAAVSAPSTVVTSTGTKTEGTHYNPGPGVTVEYGVPVSGSGAPYNLSASEVEKWGQGTSSAKDFPVEGTAIFPPDEPQSWPASDYKRATIHYWDTQGRMVNTAQPSGGIATSEYNETNEVVRTLSADNRAAALKEGSKSAEVSKKLDAESQYNGETTAEKEQEEKEGSVNPGARLLETRGPEHKVKLASGSEVQARNHVKYYYDEGSPEGKHYGLVTKTTDGAQYEGKEADVRTTTTSYGGQGTLGWTLRKPTSVTTDPGGLNLVQTTEYSTTTGNVIETKTPAASGKDATVPPTYLSEFGKPGSEPGQLKEPRATALASNGNIYVLDMGNSRIEEFTPTGSYVATFGASGKGNGQVSSPFGFAVDSKGNIWVADTGNDRIEEFNSKHEYAAQFGSEGTAGGQFKEPKAIAVTASGTIFVVDAGNNRIQKFNEKGEFISTFGFGVSNGEAKLQTCVKASECRAGTAGSGNGQFSEPRGVAVSTTGHVWVADPGNSRIQEFSESGEFLGKIGSHGTGNGQFEEPKGIAIDSAGNIWVTDAKAGRLQKFTSTGTFLSAAGSKGGEPGQFEAPWGLNVTSGGEIYIADVNSNHVDRWGPTITGNEGAHDTKTIYYTAKEEAEVSTCGNHPEWAGMPCETTLAAQPGISGLPELPVNTYTYDIWDEIEKTTEEFVSATKAKVTRTKTQTYDPAGRALTSETSSTIDTSLPKVTNTYNSETGALVEQSAPIKGETKTIKSTFNHLGQLVEYTDAEDATTKYTYDIDGRTQETSYELPGKKAGENIASQVYSYDPTSGFMTKLQDTSPTASMTFTASYDVEGNLTGKTYPNGMSATYTFSPADLVTTLEYNKTAHCTEKCTWFNDTITPSIHGEILQQNSSLASESYTYDNTGRLTQVQETPTGKGCTTRLYTYDEESDRTSLTTREPGSESKCATEGGTTERHVYDSADRLIDEGVTYETFGNTTKLPASDADGHELTSEYYVANEIAAQKQNEETIKYLYDPNGRTMETVSEGKTAAKTISHYAGSGETLTWTNEGSEKWSRNIPGIGGSLVAIQKSGELPILQLQDLQGNIIATAALSETETKLLSTYNSTEFGVPQPGMTTPSYSWFGALDISSELPTSGTVTTGASSYVPEVGRPLQTEPTTSPGAFPDGTGGAGIVGAPYLGAENGQLKTIAVEYEAELEKAKNLEAEERAKENECGASACGSSEGNPPAPPEGGAEESEEGGVEISVGGGGGDAHSAAAMTACNFKVNNPHHSSHNPGTVNVVVTLKCTDIVYNVRLRVALYFNHVKVADTGYRQFGDTAYAQENAAVPCKSGLYQGWGYVDYDAPPKQLPPFERAANWGLEVELKC
jgi:YD repeat-containing protein